MSKPRKREGKYLAQYYPVTKWQGQQPVPIGPAPWPMLLTKHGISYCNFYYVPLVNLQTLNLLKFFFVVVFASKPLILSY